MTFAPSDPSTDSRRTLLLTLLSVGLVAVGLATLAQTVRPDSFNVLDRAAFPLIALVQASLIVGLAARRISDVVAGRVFYVVLAAYLLGALHYQYLGYVAATGHLSESTYWFPVLYCSAFLAWSRREALAWTLTTHGLALLASIVHLPRWWGPDAIVDAVPWQLQFFVAGVAAILLLNYLASLQWQLSNARLVAYMDVLTGLPNRRYAEELLDQALSRRQPLTVAIFDVDHFKSVNDRFGHATGDHVLRELGRVAARELRARFDLARWGGEEFVLVMPGADLAEARRIADAAREAIEAHTFAPNLRVTVSVGLAARREGEARAALLERADAALYLAKEQGRNRVKGATLF